MENLIVKIHSDYEVPSYKTEGASGFDIKVYGSDSEISKHDLETILKFFNNENVVTLDTCHDDSKFVTNIIKPYSIVKFNTGLYFEIPKEYELQIRPRSGINSKYNFDVKFGTVDSDYRGEIKIIVHNNTDKLYIIPFGSRLAQGVIAKVEQVYFNNVQIEELSRTDRGNKGFGSTGQN